MRSAGLRYRRRFTVNAPLERVVTFHQSPESFRILAPPGLPLRLRHAPDPLVPGAELAFTLWLGPIPVRWVASLEALPEDGETRASEPGPEAAVAGFQDRQTEGPFAFWLHQHRFRPLAPAGTEIEDSIQGRLRLHPLWGPLGLLLWAGLPLLFRYRAWQTRRRLETPRAPEVPS